MTAAPAYDNSAPSATPGLLPGRRKKQVSPSIRRRSRVSWS